MSEKGSQGVNVKYIKRWVGADGKWQYEYPKKPGEEHKHATGDRIELPASGGSSTDTGKRYVTLHVDANSVTLQDEDTKQMRTFTHEQWNEIAQTRLKDRPTIMEQRRLDIIEGGKGRGGMRGVKPAPTPAGVKPPAGQLTPGQMAQRQNQDTPLPSAANPSTVAVPKAPVDPKVGARLKAWDAGKDARVEAAPDTAGQANGALLAAVLAHKALVAAGHTEMADKFAGLIRAHMQRPGTPIVGPEQEAEPPAPAQKLLAAPGAAGEPAAAAEPPRGRGRPAGQGYDMRTLRTMQQTRDKLMAVHNRLPEGSRGEIVNKIDRLSRSMNKLSETLGEPGRHPMLTPPAAPGKAGRPALAQDFKDFRASMKREVFDDLMGDQKAFEKKFKAFKKSQAALADTNRAKEILSEAGTPTPTAAPTPPTKAVESAPSQTTDVTADETDTPENVVPSEEKGAPRYTGGEQPNLPEPPKDKLPSLEGRFPGFDKHSEGVQDAIRAFPMGGILHNTASKPIHLGSKEAHAITEHLSSSARKAFIATLQDAEVVDNTYTEDNHKLITSKDPAERVKGVLQWLSHGDHGVGWAARDVLHAHESTLIPGASQLSGGDSNQPKGEGDNLNIPGKTGEGHPSRSLPKGQKLKLINSLLESQPNHPAVLAYQKETLGSVGRAQLADKLLEISYDQKNGTPAQAADLAPADSSASPQEEEKPEKVVAPETVEHPAHALLKDQKRELLSNLKASHPDHPDVVAYEKEPPKSPARSLLANKLLELAYDQKHGAPEKADSPAKAPDQLPAEPPAAPAPLAAAPAPPAAPRAPAKAPSAKPKEEAKPRGMTAQEKRANDLAGIDQVLGLHLDEMDKLVNSKSLEDKKKHSEMTNQLFQLQERAQDHIREHGGEAANLHRKPAAPAKGKTANPDSAMQQRGYATAEDLQSGSEKAKFFNRDQMQKHLQKIGQVHATPVVQDGEKFRVRLPARDKDASAAKLAFREDSLEFDTKDQAAQFSALMSHVGVPTLDLESSDLTPAEKKHFSDATAKAVSENKPLLLKMAEVIRKPNKPFVLPDADWAALSADSVRIKRSSHPDYADHPEAIKKVIDDFPRGRLVHDVASAPITAGSNHFYKITGELPNSVGKAFKDTIAGRPVNDPDYATENHRAITSAKPTERTRGLLQWLSESTNSIGKIAKEALKKYGAALAAALTIGGSFAPGQAEATPFKTSQEQSAPDDGVGGALAGAGLAALAARRKKEGGLDPAAPETPAEPPPVPKPLTGGKLKNAQRKEEAQLPSLPASSVQPLPPEAPQGRAPVPATPVTAPGSVAPPAAKAPAPAAQAPQAAPAPAPAAPAPAAPAPAAPAPSFKNALKDLDDKYKAGSDAINDAWEQQRAKHSASVKELAHLRSAHKAAAESGTPEEQAAAKKAYEAHKEKHAVASEEKKKGYIEHLKQKSAHARDAADEYAKLTTASLTPSQAAKPGPGVPYDPVASSRATAEASRQANAEILARGAARRASAEPAKPLSFYEKDVTRKMNEATIDADKAAQIPTSPTAVRPPGTSDATAKKAEPKKPSTPKTPSSAPATSWREVVAQAKAGVTPVQPSKAPPLPEKVQSALNAAVAAAPAAGKVPSGPETPAVTAGVARLAEAAVPEQNDGAQEKQHAALIDKTRETLKSQGKDPDAAMATIAQAQEKLSGKKVPDQSAVPAASNPQALDEAIAAAPKDDGKDKGDHPAPEEIAHAAGEFATSLIPEQRDGSHEQHHAALVQAIRDNLAAAGKDPDAVLEVMAAAQARQKDDKGRGDMASLTKALEKPRRAMSWREQLKEIE